MPPGSRAVRRAARQASHRRSGMTYRVIIQPAAWREVEDAFGWIAGYSPQGAARWLAGLQEAIDSLDQMAGRCAAAPESDACSEDVRQLLYGKRQAIYRILFVIRGYTV